MDGQLDVLVVDVLPDVELGPVRDGEDPDVLAGPVPPVVERPQLGALVLRVPLAELVAEGEHPLLGPGLLLVPPGATEDGVELVLGDGVEQGPGLEAVPRRVRARGPRPTRPASIDACTEATTRLAPISATVRSRKSMTSGKLWPVSTCMTGKGIRPGQKARLARCSMTTESLPPENRRTGRSNSAATSRMMWMDWDSMFCSWVS